MRQHARTYLVGSCLVLLGLAAATGAGQSPDPKAYHEQQRAFSARMEATGLAQPFKGITADGTVVPGLFAPVGIVIVFGGPILGPLVALVLVIKTVVTLCARLPPEQRRREHAETARWLLWAALLLGVPASATYAWLSGVSLFCF